MYNIPRVYSTGGTLYHRNIDNVGLKGLRRWFTCLYYVNFSILLIKSAFMIGWMINEPPCDFDNIVLDHSLPHTNDRFVFSIEMTKTIHDWKMKTGWLND